jgi:hypothetical protein
MDSKRISRDGWTLDDGEEVHRESPTTFYLPPAEIRESLQPGQLVKLIFRISLVDEDQSESVQVERMWVIVENNLLDGTYSGILDNDPYCTRDIQAGMKVIFNPKHVIQVRAA